MNFVIGDVVKTRWGNAVVCKAEPMQGRSTYAVEHLPGHTEYIWDNGIGHPPKHAWYGDDELELVAESASRAFLGDR